MHLYSDLTEDGRISNTKKINMQIIFKQKQ